MLRYKRTHGMIPFTYNSKIGKSNPLRNFIFLLNYNISRENAHNLNVEDHF